MSSIEYDKALDFSDSEVVDNDVHAQLRELHAKLNTIENEKRQVDKEKQEMQEQYNTQRAKMQRMFMQKEEELSSVSVKLIEMEEESSRLMRELEEAKSELTVAQLVKDNELEEEKQKSFVEIDRLNRICYEKVEESNTSQSEVRHLRGMVQTLHSQLTKLKLDRERDGLLPSNVVSATKNLAQMVVGKLGPDTEKPTENLEESMKKAKEDVDNIRSLVIPLEKQIEELKEKLALSEDKVRKYESGKEKKLISWSAKSSLEAEVVGLAGGGVSPSRSLGCDMCANYETQLQGQQERALALQRQKEAMEANMDKFRDDLAKETQFRKEMEEKWNEKKEEQKLQVLQLKTEMLAAQEEMTELRCAFSGFQSTVRSKISQLSFDRREISDKMEALQLENDKLVGKHSKNSEELRNEPINFPDTVEELQELLLKLHEDLIAAKVGKEAKEEAEETLRLEIGLLTNQMHCEQEGRIDRENALSAEASHLRNLLERSEIERTRLQKLLEEKKNLQHELKTVTAENTKNKETITELKKCVASLQHELGNSEAVQKDFVRLSQSLQIQLEKIRGENTQVRWQHEEDVVECSGCKNVFTSSKHKVHCRHCGQVFCAQCVPHVIPSGPNRRSSRVCHVCNTLLNRETAPYFSQDPPHSPD